MTTTATAINFTDLPGTDSATLGRWLDFMISGRADHGLDLYTDRMIAVSAELHSRALADRQWALDVSHAEALALFPGARRDQVTDRAGRPVWMHTTVHVVIDEDHGNAATVHLLSTPDIFLTVPKDQLTPAYR